MTKIVDAVAESVVRPQSEEIGRLEVVKMTSGRRLAMGERRLPFVFLNKFSKPFSNCI